MISSEKKSITLRGVVEVEEDKRRTVFLLWGEGEFKWEFSILKRISSARSNLNLGKPWQVRLDDL
jgi:hypothetical protein